MALVDQTDKSSIYFAQIRAFMVDEYGSKSAILTWLIPTSLEHQSIKTLKDFDPSLFVLGPAEELPRPLDCMEFVCRLGDANASYFANANESTYTDSLVTYKNNLLKHKFVLSDLVSMDAKVITKKYWNSKGEELAVEHNIAV